MYDGLSGWNSQGTASGQNAPRRFSGIFSTEQNLLFLILNCPAASLDCNYGVSVGLGNKERQRNHRPAGWIQIFWTATCPTFFCWPAPLCCCKLTMVRFIPSVYKYAQEDGSSIHTSYRDSPSYETKHRGKLVKTDDPSTCPFLYTDGLSDELPFFAQACPRRIIHLQYKSVQ